MHTTNIPTSHQYNQPRTYPVPEWTHDTMYIPTPWYQRYPPPCGQNDTCLWKHYLRENPLADGNYHQIICKPCTHVKQGNHSKFITDRVAGNVMYHRCVSFILSMGLYPRMQSNSQEGGSVYPRMQWCRHGNGWCVSQHSMEQAGEEVVCIRIQWGGQGWCEAGGTHPTWMHPC